MHPTRRRSTAAARKATRITRRWERRKPRSKARKKKGRDRSRPFVCITRNVRSLLRLGALGRGGRPRLHQRVVVDGFALRLFVRQLALGSDVAVFRGLGEPELGRLL